MRSIPWVLWLAACEPGVVTLPGTTPPTDGVDTGTPTVLPPGQPEVVDLALSSGALDLWDGHFQRGRSCAPEDYDGDGLLDVMLGNAGDISRILRNVTEPGGPLQYEPAQILVSGEAYDYWGNTPADLDNDGDIDLFVSAGGNERIERNAMWINETVPGGPITLVKAPFEPVPRRPDGQEVVPATTGSLGLDFDGDAVIDIFSSVNVLQPGDLSLLEPFMVTGLNQLWRGVPGQAPQDLSVPSGLDTQWSTQNSSVLDFDNDGDTDIFENNKFGPNLLWRNRLKEDGLATFENVTDEMSLAGADLTWPQTGASSFCSIAADLNNDGWQDLVVFRRYVKTDDEPDAHGTGHLMWLNVEGRGFVEGGAHSQLPATMTLLRDHGAYVGTMACQHGDVNADGWIDLWTGNGGPESGSENDLYVQTGLKEVDFPGVGPVQVPQFESWNELVNFPAELPEDYVPEDELEYPYRTHGGCLADFDGDGLDELYNSNGGTMKVGPPEWNREPDQLFDFRYEVAPNWLRVKVEGDGVRVARDAPGTRVRVRARYPDGTEQDLWRFRQVGSGFGSHNGPDLLFGLADAEEVLEIEVFWQDDTVTQVDPAMNERVVVRR